MRILVIEDDEKVASFVRRGLEESNYSADVMHRGEEALALMPRAADTYGAIILDLALPDIDGVSLLKTLRHRGVDIPVLVLSARSDLSDRVYGLDSGADDYLTKPFALSELLARLRALCRSYATAKSVPEIQYSGIVLNRSTRTVKLNGKRIDLSNREYALLDLFLRNPGRVFSRSDILETVWGSESSIQEQSNIVDVYMSLLRKKLSIPGQDNLIHTVFGVGYMLCEPAESA